MDGAGSKHRRESSPMWRDQRYLCFISAAETEMCNFINSIEDRRWKTIVRQGICCYKVAGALQHFTKLAHSLPLMLWYLKHGNPCQIPPLIPPSYDQWGEIISKQKKTNDYSLHIATTWIPWKPVATKKIDLYTLSTIANEDSLYSMSWRMASITRCLTFHSFS